MGRHTVVMRWNAKTERGNGVITDVLRSFVSERQDDWPALLPLVEFVINRHGVYPVLR